MYIKIKIPLYNQNAKSSRIQSIYILLLLLKYFINLKKKHSTEIHD